MILITESNQSNQPYSLDVRVLLPDVDLVYRAEVTLALRVRRDFPDSAKVGILLLHSGSLLSSLGSAVLILKGAPNGTGV